MANKIIFFNHFHRGDLFTHKEFTRQVKEELASVPLEYWHFNHQKLNRDLGIPLTGFPDRLDRNIKFYSLDNSTLFVNTWIGTYGEIFNKHGGVNLQSLSDSWKEIYKQINSFFSSNIQVSDDLQRYIPRIDYNAYNLENVNKFLNDRSNKKVLICNGIPMSNQSFASNLENEIKHFANKYINIDFICTANFKAEYPNIFFTDDIIQDSEMYSFNAPWHDRPQNNCDVNEISYLSRHCDLIVGKNSGPFVFCETYDNYMDSSKTIISFSRGAQESMSNSINMKCRYNLVTDHSAESIMNSIEKELIKL